MQNSPGVPVRAVLFDLDDTLFDHLHSTRQGLQAICQAYPFLQRCSVEELFADYTRLLDEVHLRVLEGSLSLAEARHERFRRFFSLHAPTTLDLLKAVEHAANLHRETYQAHRQVVAGVVPLLQYLRGKVKIVIVTNNLLVEQVEKLRHLQLDSLVDELVTAEETGFIKPDPGIFRVALERIRCRAEEVVMIGDAWESDVLGATQLGIRTLWLNRTGLTCPDPDLARELQSFEPLDEVLDLILGHANVAEACPQA